MQLYMGGHLDISIGKQSSHLSISLAWSEENKEATEIGVEWTEGQVVRNKPKGQPLLE